MVTPRRQEGRHKVDKAWIRTAMASLRLLLAKDEPGVGNRLFHTSAEKAANVLQILETWGFGDTCAGERRLFQGYIKESKYHMWSFSFKLTKVKASIVAYICNFSIWKKRQENQEFKAMFDYVLS